MLLMTVVFAVVRPLMAVTWTDPDTGYTWNYRIDGDTAEICVVVDADGVIVSGAISPNPTGTVTIPSTLPSSPATPSNVEYCRVVSIGHDALAHTDLTGVTIPISVTNIGEYAFGGCDGLTNVVVPCSVKSIGEVAFKYCFGLVSVTISDGTTNIGKEAFRDCCNLTNLMLPDVIDIGKGAFLGCTRLADDKGFIIVRNVLYEYIGEDIDVNIPMGVTDIGMLAFYGRWDLRSVVIPDGVKSIGEWAFRYCPITDLALPNSVTDIGECAFSDCGNLTSLAIPKNMASIGERAFGMCPCLADDKGFVIVCNILFNYFGEDAVVTIPTSVTNIDAWACSGYDVVTVTIPDSVISIGEMAFGNCRNLASVTIGNSITSIGYGAFSICSGLTSVTIPRSVVNVEGRAFEFCSSLTNVTFKGNAPSVGEYVFDGVNPSCVAYVQMGSSGWGVNIPGSWNGIRIEYGKGTDPLDDVVVDVGGGKSVTVPQTWVAGHLALVEAAGGDAAAALNSTAANGRMSVVECYVVGLDPEKADDDFKITSLPMKADGTPDLANIVFDPPQAEWNVPGATPVVKGAATLDGEWQTVIEDNKAGFRFFKVVVEVP